jgi:hypothetical protein
MLWRGRSELCAHPMTAIVISAVLLIAAVIFVLLLAMRS